MEHRETHLGHEIAVDVTKLRQHAYTWSYLIDGRIQGGSVRPLPDEQTALQFGIKAARARAESLG